MPCTSTQTFALKYADHVLGSRNDVWGDTHSAPDDKENATLSGGNI